MARLNAFTVKVDVAPVEALADKLAGLTPEHIGAMVVGAINETVASAYELSRRTILSGINLTDEYVQSHMQVETATANNPVATIVAFGGRGHSTQLSHYGAMQETQPAEQPARSKGDPARGIPAGQKAAGMSVEVVRGSRKTLEHGFTMPGKVDSEGKPLVFTRGKDGKIRSRVGPSVYQLFRVAGAKIENEVYGDLAQAVLDSAERQMAKEFT